MKKYLILASLTLSSQAFAQSCQGLSEGQEIRLDQGDKSLRNFKVQDQDGLGSCYANSASILLQATLPNNPEVSYLHIAALNKTADLQSKAKSSNVDYDNLYATNKVNPDTVTNGSSHQSWDVALNSGGACNAIDRIKDLQKKNKGAVLCSKDSMNLERILESGDKDFKQFKTILQSSIYMNKFQKIFGNTDDNKNSNAAIQGKYKAFKDSFEKLIANKHKKIEEQSCNKINTDNLSPLLEPLTQRGISYDCFLPTSQYKTTSWCKVAQALVYKPTTQADGSIKTQGSNPEWLKKLQARIAQRKAPFTSAGLSQDVAESFVDSLNVSPMERNQIKNYFVDQIINQTSLDKNLAALANEYNEVATKGNSPQCVKRVMYNFFETKEYEDTWKSDPILCQNAELMSQASNVIMNYKAAGIDDLDSVVGFLTNKAGANYDEAMMALYATDCEAKGKISIPENLNCEWDEVTPRKKDKINSLISENIKNNKPLVVEICASIVKKPLSQFAKNECGKHNSAVIGMKCVQGKIKYLVQNSWGTMSKAANPDLETVEGKGSYWFDEKSFYDSVYGLMHMEQN